MLFQLLMEKQHDGAYLIIVNLGYGEKMKTLDNMAEVHEFVTGELNKWFKGETE